MELADIFRQYGPGYRQTHPLPASQHQLMRAIEHCRTAALAGHVEQCSRDSCAHTRNSYNSCRNRHCPKCQAPARRKWLAQRKAELLPVPYFHVVFTLPAPLRCIAFQNKAVMYDLLFRSAADTLLTIARDPRHLGAEIGFFGILHTWGQNLQHHPHVHFVVPGGGLSSDRQHWMRPRRPRFLVPVRVLAALFRRLLLAAVQAAFAQRKLQFFSELQPLQDASAFAAYLKPLANIAWVVHAKPPFGGPQQVLAYLGRYTHRVAISNDRLLGCANGQVSFQWKDYRDRSRSKTMTLDAEEFIRRFLLHALPSGFQRIRYYGFLTNMHRRRNLELCRRLLTADPTQLLPDIAPAETDEILLNRGTRCPVCGVGLMVRLQRLLPLTRVAAVDSS
jgi:hypothetical protein